MKTINRKLDEIGGVELKSSDLSEILGGNIPLYLVDCTCKNGEENVGDIWYASVDNVIDTYLAQEMCETMYPGMTDSLACVIQEIEVQ